MSVNMKIYLDACVYNRPFDDQKRPRIVIEALEFLLLLTKAEVGEIKLVSSFALEYENENNPYVDRREIIADIMKSATEHVVCTDGVMNRAREIEKSGIMGLDAIHIACAEEARADCFITCDDVLFKKAGKINDRLKVKVISLLRFVNEEVFEL